MWLRPKLFLIILPLVSRLQGCRGLTGKAHYISAKYSSSSFHLYDDMSDKVNTPDYTMLWFDEVTSTMDKARELSSKIPSKFFAVGATSQLKGRGTRGRDWISSNNNLLLTIAIHRSLVPIPITLLPLRVGSIIGSCMARRVTAPQSQLTLKWPNDILINSRKACGVLIEMEGDMLLVGIGCNVLAAPTVNAATNGPNAAPVIRPATCLAEHNAELAALAASLLAQQRQQSEQSEGDSGNTHNSMNSTVIPPLSISREHTDTTESISGSSKMDGVPVQLTLRHGDAHKELGIEICDSLHHWATARTDTAAQVLGDFSRNMDYSPQRLRDVADPLLSTVIPTGLNPDGTLKVKYAHNGEEGMLMAEYLW